MELKTANRQKVKIKLALQGASGSGKTYSALVLAYGLCKNWSSIAVIDTENHSSELYAHLGTFNVVHIGAPYTPEKYSEAIKLCEKAGMEVIILDSISHEWEGSGGILDIHSNMVGNSFTNWGKLTPRHNLFIQTILQSPCHVIGTIRSKQEYVLNEKNGKMVPEKVGLKGVTRDGMDYEFTLVLEIDAKHYATANKDRTSLFVDKPPFVITQSTGETIIEWCNCNASLLPIADEISFEVQIQMCSTLQELINLYNSISVVKQTYYKTSFAEKRNVIQQSNSSTNLLINHLNPSNNGQSTTNTH